jgi:hypothetical protein
MDTWEEIKKSLLTEHVKLAIGGFWIAVWGTLFGAILFGKTYIVASLWPSVPKILLLLLTIVFFCTSATFILLWLKARRSLNSFKAAIDSAKVLPNPEPILEKELPFEPDEFEQLILIDLYSNKVRIEQEMLRRLGISDQQLLTYHLVRLIQNNYVNAPPHHPFQARIEIGYTLTQRGREYVIKNNLIPENRSKRQKRSD